MRSPHDNLFTRWRAGILAKGTRGTILEHVEGKKTKFISGSEGKFDARFDSGNGLVEIDPKGLNMIGQKNVIKGTSKNAKAAQNAKRSNEVFFQKNIPNSNIKKIKL